MGIDAWVGPLAQSWLGLQPRVLDLLEDPSRLVLPGEPWDFGDVAKVLDAHPPDDFWDIELTPAMEAGLHERVDRFQRRLCDRLGLQGAWDDRSEPLEEEVPFEEVRQLDGGGLYRMQQVAARLESDGSLRSPLVEVGSDPTFEAVRKGTEESHFPQTVHLDINSVFVPLDFGPPLLGLPNRIGSAPRLLSELETLLEQYERLPEGARGFDFELRKLRGRAQVAVERQMPLHLEG